MLTRAIRHLDSCRSRDHRRRGDRLQVGRRAGPGLLHGPATDPARRHAAQRVRPRPRLRRRRVGPGPGRAAELFAAGGPTGRQQRHRRQRAAGPQRGPQRAVQAGPGSL